MILGSEGPLEVIYSNISLNNPKDGHPATQQDGLRVQRSELELQSLTLWEVKGEDHLLWRHSCLICKTGMLKRKQQDFRTAECKKQSLNAKYCAWNTVGALVNVSKTSNEKEADTRRAELSGTGSTICLKVLASVELKSALQSLQPAALASGGRSGIDAVRGERESPQIRRVEAVSKARSAYEGDVL